MNNINDQNGNENINYLLKFSHVILKKIINIVKKLFLFRKIQKVFSFWKKVFFILENSIFILKKNRIFSYEIKFFRNGEGMFIFLQRNNNFQL